VKLVDTRQEHYAEAERLVAGYTNRDLLAAEVAAAMTVAQVHAALAAAPAELFTEEPRA